MPQDSRRKLYDALSQNYDLGTFNEFNKKMDVPDSRRRLYDAVSESFDLGTFDEFEGKIGSPRSMSDEDFTNELNKMAEERKQSRPTTYQVAQPNTEGYNFGGDLKEIPRPKINRQSGRVAQSTPQPTGSVPPVYERPSVPTQQSLEGAGGRPMPFDKLPGYQEEKAEYEKAQQRLNQLRYEQKKKAKEESAYKMSDNRGQAYTPGQEALESTSPYPRAEKESLKQYEQKRFDDELSAVFVNYDTDNVAEQVWNDAEERTREAQAKHNDEIWGNYASMGGGREMRMMASGEARMKNMADYLTEHDLKRLADNAWQALGAEKQEAITNDIYAALMKRYPNADANELYPMAREIARQQSDQRMFELAVEKNAPKSATDFFFRKVLSQNMIYKLEEALGRAAAGTTGDMEARDMAMQRYADDSHKFLGFLGTAAGMGLDPMMWISAGVGGAAARGVTRLGGKVLAKKGGEAAMREFGSTLGGRLLTGAAGGAGNFATFEALGEGLEQLRYGGARNEETGEIEGYDIADILKAGGRGLLLGAGTGVVAPLIGNVSDDLVRSIKSTGGKLASRAGQVALGKVAEGTIFSVPEWIEGEREAMDVWTDNMAMMLAFGLHGAVKSAPKRIAELSKNPNSKAGFETRLRTVLDGRPDLTLSESEKAELKRAGYGDLNNLVEEYTAYNDAKKADRLSEELPYNRFAAMINDGSVSEAARAKMYYYLTGQQLPMSTVMGPMPVIEHKDANGKVTGYTVRSVGANGVITSRDYSSKAAADAEVERINRQAELNGVDVGEKYYNYKGEKQRMRDACEVVAQQKGVTADALYKMMQRQPEEMSDVEKIWASEIVDEYTARAGENYYSLGLREDINDKNGVDVDKAIAKEPNRRSDQEKAAVKEYIQRLFGEKMPVEVEETPYERGYNADPEERKKIFIEAAAGTENEEALLDGVRQKIEDDADYQAAMMREEVKMRSYNADGSEHPVEMKDGNTVYLKDGNIVTAEDGSVDIENSDQMVTVYDPTQGKNVPISPIDIKSMGEVRSAEDIENEIMRERDALVQSQLDDAQNKITVGTTFQTEEGVDAQVVAITGDDIIYMTADGQQGTMPLQATQELVDAMALENLRTENEGGAENGERRTENEEGTLIAGVPEEYVPNMELTIKDEDGNERNVVVTGGRARLTAKGYEDAPDGSFVELYNPESGNVEYIRKDKLDEQVQGYRAPVETHAPVASDTPSNLEGERTENEIESGISETEQENVAKGSEADDNIVASDELNGSNGQENAEIPDAMPMLKSGKGKGKNPDFMAVEPERSHRYLYGGEAGLDSDEADQFVKAQIAAAENILTGKSGKKVPKMGTDLAKYQKEKAAYEQTMNDARAALEYWNGVKAIQDGIVEEERRRKNEEARVAKELERQRLEAEEAEQRAKAEEERRRRTAELEAVQDIGNDNTVDWPIEEDAKAMEIMNDTQPRTIEEVAAGVLAGGKYRLIPEEARRHTGFSTKDFTKMPFIFAGADKGGISPEHMGEIIENEARYENVKFDEADINIGFNALLNVLGEVSSLGDLKNYIKNRRKAQAEEIHSDNVRKTAEMIAAEDAWMRETIGVDAKEYEVWVADMEERAAAVANMTEEEFNNYILSNYDRRSEETIGRGTEESTASLRGQESVEAGVAADDARRDGEVDERTENGEPASIEAESEEALKDEGAPESARSKSAADVEAGGAVVDKLQSMGVDVNTDIAENRRIRKQAEQDNSEAGQIHDLKTTDGKVYGFTYRGGIYLDPRKIDAELPLHEYGHLWTEAYRVLNPEGWREVIETIKQDADGWNMVKEMYPDLKTDSEIADEVIATFSGKKGAEKLKAELERMAAKTPDYKSRWGNIYNNIVKAIQDFWKKIGDFLGIKYETPEQVYDQVLKDFASGMNPRARVEEYLKERDAEYMDAVERGDESRAKELFDEALRENIGNGITPYVAVGKYRGDMDRLARGVKSRDPKIIAEVADLMAPIIPEDAVLVPAPSHSGEATDMLDVANAIAERTGAPVADVLRGVARGSQREAKREGAPITSGEMGITMEGELPEGKTPVVIDNVVNSGNTAEACVKALGKGVVASLADAADRYRHVASLKSANAVVRDKNGNVVPLSKRFELGGSGYLAKQKGEGAAVEFTPEEKATQKAVDEMLGGILGKDYVVDAEEGQRVLDEYRDQVRALRAYHGSGADFEQFDQSHMGEGEGAQAYGYGTYVTEVEGIGKMYAENTGKMRYKGEPVYSDPYSDNAAERALFYVEQERGFENAIKFIKGQKNDEEDADTIRDYDEVINCLKDRENWKEPQRVLYTVDIPDDNGSNYLSYDKPATDEQVDRIKNALLSNDKFKEDSREEYDFMSLRLGDVQYIPPFEEWMDNRAGVIAMGAKERGQRVYDEIAKLLDSEKKASELLHTAGFVGVKYPAEYRSGGRSDGAKNYVIFDEGDLQITDKIRFFRTEDGEVLGYTLNGKVYIDPRVATTETRVHEYSHLWAQALRNANPKAWEQLKSEMMSLTKLVDYVRNKYPELDKSDDEFVEEVFAHYSGKRGAERLEADMREAMAAEPDIVEKAGIANMFHKLRDLLKKFWTMARDLFAGKVKGVEKLTAEDFADMTLNDLLNGFNPSGKRKAESRKQTKSEKRDAEYMAAVERGDMETAQRMVLEAAKAAMPKTKVVDENGMPLVLYHGTTKDFTVFDKKKIGKANYGRAGFFFTPDKSLATDFTRYRWQNPNSKIKNNSHIVKVFLNATNPLYISGREYTMNILDNKDLSQYDSVIITPFTKDEKTIWDRIFGGEKSGSKEFDYNQYCVFDPSQIKSADSVTYDDEGNVIPLSKRFDKRNADVRFHKGGTYRTKDGVQLSMESLFDGSDGLNGQDESGDLTGLRLRKLEPGETCLVERRYEENKMFSFVGKEKIESMDDVAYIFKQLEDAAVENVFVAMVKDGRPTVIHIGMGTYNQSVADYKLAFAAYASIKPDKVWMVHNHPSGTLRASREDRNLLQVGRETFGNDVMQDGIIIDTVSGKYGVFNDNGSNYEQNMPEASSEAVPVKTFEFSKQVFAPEWNPREAFQLTDSGKVAEFVSSHRLGEHKKMSFIVVNNQNQVVGNFFLPWTKMSEAAEDPEGASRELSNYVNLAGGTKGVLYGNYEYDSNEKRALGKLIEGMLNLRTPLLDVVHFDKESVYHSAAETGVMEGEGEYGKRDRIGNPIGNGKYHVKHKVEKFKEYPQIKSSVSESNTTESVYVTYRNTENGKTIRVRFSNHENNATKFGDELDGYVATRDEILYHLGLRKREFVPLMRAFIPSRQVSKKDLQNGTYPESEYTIQEMYDKVKKGESISDEVGKLAKGSNYLIQGDGKMLKETKKDSFGRTVAVGDYKYSNPIEPQQRQAKAITDEQVEMRSTVEQMSEKLHSDIEIIEDVEQTEGLTERQKKAKGWYDPVKRKVTVVLENNRDRDDAMATVFHETVQHKGMREMIGEERWGEFLDTVYGALRDELKSEVDRSTYETFMNGLFGTENGERRTENEYIRERRRQVDELMGRIAEKMPEDMTDAEMTLWEKICTLVRKAIDKFLGDLKLPKWVRLGENEIRYMLWKSRERLEDEGYVGMAKDALKRDELGLNNEVIFSSASQKNESKRRKERRETNYTIDYATSLVTGRNINDISKERVAKEAVRREQAKKIYENILSGEFNDVSLQSINDYINDVTPNNPYGRRLSERLPQRVERKVAGEMGIAAIDTLFGRASESSVSPNGRTRPEGRRAIEGKKKESLEKWAKATGNWHTDLKDFTDDTEPIGHGTDSDVYISKDGRHVIKLSHGKPEGKRFRPDIDNIALFNYVFPASAYKILGYGNFGKGFVRILEQPYVDFETSVPLSVEEREAFMNSLGFKAINKDKTAFSNGEIVVADLQKSNIVRDGDGNIHVIDADCKLHTKDIGGKYEYLPVEHDLPQNEKGNSQDADLMFRDEEEEEPVNPQSMSVMERIAATAVQYAKDHEKDRNARNRAIEKINASLADIRKAMGAQRTYDRTTVKRVSDLVQVLMQHGWLSNLGQGEMKRLLSVVKNATGKEDTSKEVETIMDMMVENQLKNAEAQLHNMETIKGSKVDAKGVEVQGALDVAGQQVMKTFKEARHWLPEALEEAIVNTQERMGSDNKAVAEEATNRFVGLMFAQEYIENIKKSKEEDQQLRQSIKDYDGPAESKKEFIASVEDAIRQNKIERIEAYYDLMNRISERLQESIKGAQAFKDAEVERIREIQHNANSDMEGRPSNEHYEPTFKDKFVNNSFVQFGFAPLATFDQMLRLIGSKSANGEGYLYNRFMRDWVDAREKEIRGVREKYARLDEKVKELFGGRVKSMADLIRATSKMPKMDVEMWNGGMMQPMKLTQGNLMYIYMVNKMSDGRMKLRKMGITEDVVDKITEKLDPKIKELADWIQDEFLVETRNEYNETHKRVFGANMAAIDNYFPLKILANARADKPEDLDNPDMNEGISTKTGSIIKRTRNALALDVTGADALNVILDHVAQMEHWNAFAEFNKDLNTLRTYKHFRNQMQNMTSIYGSGKELWKKFNDVSQMASGSYRPPQAKLDKAAVNFAKGVTAAKVSFRVFTAMKQLLSMPAFASEVRPDIWAANIATPWKAWNWAMDNLPIFEERWKSRIAGDPRLMKSELDWKGWRNNIVQIALRIGMSPNAFVDALTVSIGARSVYQTKKAQYLKDGYSEEQADRRAKQDAEIAYNQTQQSSEGVFTSTMQVDRSWLSVMFTVFRNASMSYTRQLWDAVRNLKRNLTPGQRTKSIEFMTKQMVRDGVDEEQAEKSAKRKFNRQLRKDVTRVAVFGYILQFAWNLGPYLPYLLIGDDDDEKQKMWDDVLAHSMFGWLEGFTGGDVVSEAGKMFVQGEGNPEYLKKEMPITSDAYKVLREIGAGKYGEVVNDLVNLVVQMGLGVNPQSITDAVLAIMDACGDDPKLANEAAIAVMRILQFPQNQIDKIYFDELGLRGDEVSNYTPQQLIERYAQYKVKRGHFITPWNWDDEEALSKQEKKADTLIKERLESFGDAAVNEEYDKWEQLKKDVPAIDKAARETAKERALKEPYNDYAEYAERFLRYYKEELEKNGTSIEEVNKVNVFKKRDKDLEKTIKLYLNSKTAKEAQKRLEGIVEKKKEIVEYLNKKE